MAASLFRGRWIDLWCHYNVCTRDMVMSCSFFCLAFIYRSTTHDYQLSVCHKQTKSRFQFSSLYHPMNHTWGPFYLHYLMWDSITHPSSNLNHGENRTWMSNYTIFCRNIYLSIHTKLLGAYTRCHTVIYRIPRSKIAYLAPISVFPGDDSIPVPVDRLQWNDAWRLSMRRKFRERFPRHHGLAIPTCITARAWRTWRDACRDRKQAVCFEVSGGEKRSRHSRGMRNPQFYVSGIRPIEEVPFCVCVYVCYIRIVRSRMPQSPPISKCPGCYSSFNLEMAMELHTKLRGA